MRNEQKIALCHSLEVLIYKSNPSHTTDRAHGSVTGVLAPGFQNYFHKKHQPLMTAIGRSLRAFLLIPAAWQVLTTSETSL